MLACTAQESKDEQKVFVLGAADFVTKPLTVENRIKDLKIGFAHIYAQMPDSDSSLVPISDSRKIVKHAGFLYLKVSNEILEVLDEIRAKNYEVTVM